ncbi:CAP domain-containing protein [Streptomyces sp. NPDC053431]|uniref:CAP domain-containing protein n=1 Tax=Streptomyces sp. NPDC053431 TaxID=3365703 RepID=UPI0037D5DBE2
MIQWRWTATRRSWTAPRRICVSAGRQGCRRGESAAAGSDYDPKEKGGSPDRRAGPTAWPCNCGSTCIWHAVSRAERAYGRRSRVSWPKRSPARDWPKDRVPVRPRGGGTENPWSRSGENIAKGQADAAAVMDAWMNSPGHRANILNCGFTEIGVGVGTDGGPSWTQDSGPRIQDFGTPP